MLAVSGSSSLEQYVGRLSHDRTTVRHWRRLGSNRKYVPWSQHTRGSPRHVSQGSYCAIIISPFHRGGRPSWNGGLSVGPLPPRTACRQHPRIAPTAQYHRRCAWWLGLVRQWETRRAAHCRPSACLLVGGQLACRQVTPGNPDVVCHRGGTGDRGLFAPQSTCPGILVEAGVTPAVHLRGPAPLAASPTQPIDESGKCLQNSQCQTGRGGADTHARAQFAASLDTWVIVVYQQCTP